MRLPGGGKRRTLLRVQETHSKAQVILETLGLEAHPLEGGFFRETWRDPCSTAIYYLLTDETFSAMHRLPGAEVFHHYLGDPVAMLQIGPDGRGRVVRLGSDLAAGLRPQVVVPGNTWQGSRLEPGGRFALLGTTMAPGFEAGDYETGRREALTALCPEFADEIRSLTREPGGG